MLATTFHLKIFSHDSSGRGHLFKTNAKMTCMSINKQQTLISLSIDSLPTATKGKFFRSWQLNNRTRAMNSKCKRGPKYYIKQKSLHIHSQTHFFGVEFLKGGKNSELIVRPCLPQTTTRDLSGNPQADLLTSKAFPGRTLTTYQMGKNHHLATSNHLLYFYFKKESKWFEVAHWGCSKSWAYPTGPGEGSAQGAWINSCRALQGGGVKGSKI